MQRLKQSSELAAAKWRGLKFVRGTVRDYIFILQEKHFTAVDTAVKSMMRTKWFNHFSELDI